MKHATAGVVGVKAPNLSKYIGEQAKTNASIMKQLRLSQEEREADHKKKKAKGAGKDKDE